MRWTARDTAGFPSALALSGITGLDISQTLVGMARQNARNVGATVDFRLGNASAMPFDDESFDCAYCSAAFKNFSEPVKALDEMHRVLRPGGEAVVVDLCKDASLDDIDSYVKNSGRSRIDAWMTKWTFRHMLLKRAYTENDFVRMAKQSRFGTCHAKASSIGIEVRFAKTGLECAVSRGGGQRMKDLRPDQAAPKSGEGKRVRQEVFAPGPV